jgi:RNase adaptor protein for sRNA GlmZ degradation
MLASTTPIFAADSTNSVVLTADQLAKLTETQTKLTDLVTKITGLLTTYKDNRNTHGLLMALNQFKKQVNRTNQHINYYKENPVDPADRIIQMFQDRSTQLEKKVSIVEKILIKKTQPVTLTTEQLTKLTDTQTKLTALNTKIDGLLTTYKESRKTHGLRMALKQFKKQSSHLNSEITDYTKNPTAPADKQIQKFQHKEANLEKNVSTVEKLLVKKTTTKTTTKNKTAS